MSSLPKRLYKYQARRFPLVALGISLLPAVLSSGAITTTDPTPARIALAVAAGLFYLFHIRVIDEHRDFDHDNLHHADRPVQSGLISTADLRIANTWATTGLALIAISSGNSAVLITAAMLGYSYLASKDFFIGARIRQHFFIYNSVNIVQMLLMQLLIYTIFAGTLSYSPLLLQHFLFTSVGTILFEFLRKIHLPEHEGTGKDTYSFHLGFKNTLAIATAILALDGWLFYRTATLITFSADWWLPSTIGLVLFGALAALVHGMKKRKLTEQGLQLIFLLVYAAFNIALYMLRGN